MSRVYFDPSTNSGILIDGDKRRVLSILELVEMANGGGAPAAAKPKPSAEIPPPAAGQGDRMVFDPFIKQWVSKPAAGVMGEKEIAGQHVVQCGKKYLGWKVCEIPRLDLRSYCEFLVGKSEESGKPLSLDEKEMIRNAEVFLK